MFMASFHAKRKTFRSGMLPSLWKHSPFLPVQEAKTRSVGTFSRTGFHPWCDGQKNGMVVCARWLENYATFTLPCSPGPLLHHQSLGYHTTLTDEELDTG